MIQQQEKREAVFSSCRAYRYRLSIIWDDSKQLVQVIGLNPSTADEVKDDPTIRKCKGFARLWGFGGIVMTNLFAFRSTDPKAMKRAQYPIGEANDTTLVAAASGVAFTLAAWGNDGEFLDRGKHVCGLLSELKCLGLTGAGQPKHPLYPPYSTPLAL